MLRGALTVTALTLALATGTSAEENATAWLDLEEGLHRAKETGLPLVVWVAPCGSCGKAAFEDPDVVSMLPDFVAVQGGPDEARRLGVSADRAHAVLLDAAGQPIDDIKVSAEQFGPLPTEQLIDAMSSALDIVR
ncbi:MAG: hypothetical protein AAF409_12765 [Pseudomonadota bacterium]